eukprot:5614611-Amphidinium_carterae.1
MASARLQEAAELSTSLGGIDAVEQPPLQDSEARMVDPTEHVVYASDQAVGSRRLMAPWTPCL